MSVNPNKSVKSRSGQRGLHRRILKGLILAAVLWLVFMLTGRVLRRIAFAQIAELTNAKVEAKSVNFKLNGSVLIKGLVIRPLLIADRPDQEQKYDDAILKAKTVYARFGKVSLLLLRPRLKKISVKDFVLNAQQNLDTGSWNLATLKIKVPKGGLGEIPTVRLKRGSLQYSKVSNGQREVAAAIPINARFGPAEKTQGGSIFSITTAERVGSGKSTLTGFWRPGKITIAGGISSSDIPVSKCGWTINGLEAELNYDRKNTYSLKLKIKDLLSTHTLRLDAFAEGSGTFLEKIGLFTALQRFFKQYRPTGRVGIDLEASGNLDRLSESELAGKVYCKDASICNYKFPYSIEHIVGPIDFTEKRVLLNNLCGQHGDVKLFFNGWLKDFGPNWQYQVQLTSDNMALDNDLYNALSENQKSLWSVFSPSGVAAINYRISRQSQTDKKATLVVELLDVEAAYRHFPYPLKNLTGKLLFEHDNITISDLVSQSNERKITINGKVIAYSTERPIYDVSISANNVPLDSTLAASLSDKQRYLYNRLNMTGLADAEIKILTSKDDSGPSNFTAIVSFKKTSLKAEDLPMVISDVSAETIVTPDLIHIGNLTGRYGESSVSLTGRIWPAKEAKQLRYRLFLHAEQAELNDDLFSLLPSPLGKIVSKLQPEGKINFRADLNKTDRGNYPDYRITVDCLGDSVNFESFPYPLKDITGGITITKDSIKLGSITATSADNVQITPSTSAIKINGQIALANNSFSSAEFALCANDIFLDERLGIALPEGIQAFYRNLSPTGRFDLDLENIKIFNADNGEKYIDFAGITKFKNCNFNTSPAITELDAVLKLKGLYKTGDGLLDGQAILSADKLKIVGKSLTRLKADIDYNHNLQNWLTKNLIADCHGGKLAGKLELKQSAEAALKYLLQVGFDNIDLKQFLSDSRPKKTSGNGYTSGKMSGSLSISGQIGDSFPRIGRCRLAISDMQVGKLSPMGRLLYVLKLTESKDFTFDRMLVDSYIRHNRLFFEQIDLSGEAVAFNGSGWMDLRSQNVDLTLTARGRRLATAEPSVLQSLTESLGPAVVRMEVSGNVYDPKIETKTLPVIKEAVEILGTPR